MLVMPTAWALVSNEVASQQKLQVAQYLIEEHSIPQLIC